MYNTRTKKGDFQEALANLEQNITNSINSITTELKKEINSLKDVIIKQLLDENLILRGRCSKLDQKLIEFECSTNNLEQYGRRNNIISSGILDSIDNNQLEESATEILTDINVNVASIDIEALKLVLGLVRGILKLAALKPLFVSLTGNILSKLCKIKIKFLKSKENIHLTLTIIPFSLART